MGSGFYDQAAASARSSVRQTARQADPTVRVLTASRLDQGLNPLGLLYRESRDNDEHPNSVAFVFEVDITQSMRGVPEQLATETLPHFMKAVLPFVPDAQILIGAFGDADDGNRAEAPWQIGQFESDDALVDQWLTRLYLGGSGGSAPYESADLALYFAARLTRIDCHEKRGKKGYLFLITDDICRNVVNARTVNRLLGREELAQNVPIEQIIAEASEKFHVFCLIPDRERAGYDRDHERVDTHWKRRVGNGMIVLNDQSEAAIVAAMIVGLTEGNYNMVNVDFELRQTFNKSGRELERLLSVLRPYAESLTKSVR